jgi:hypothetical protein
MIENPFANISVDEAFTAVYAPGRETPLPVENSAAAESPAEIKPAVLPEMEAPSTLPDFAATTELTLIEYFDEDVADALMNDPMLSSKDKRRLQDYVRQRRRNPGEAEVVYRLSEGCESDLLGRLYALYSLGLQAMRWDIRNALCRKFVYDLDIQNAHYTFALKLCRLLGLPCEAIAAYVADPKAWRQRIHQSKDIAKVKPIMVLYGGSKDGTGLNYLTEDDWNAEILPAGQALLDRLKPEVEALANYVWEQNPHLQTVRTGKEKKPMNKRKNPKAALLNYILCSEEKKCVLALKHHLEAAGRSVTSIIHDGLHVRRAEGETHFSDSILRSGEAFIQEATGYAVILAEKPIESYYTFRRPEGDKEAEESERKLRWNYVLENSGPSLCKFYMLQKKNTVLYSASEKMFYLYDEREGIWHCHVPTDINNDFLEVCGRAMRRMYAEIDIIETDKEKREDLTKKLGKALQSVMGHGVKHITNFLPTFCRPDFEPRVLFNNADEDLYPCANGAYRFSTGELEDYKPEHYFTFKVPVAYNPEADYTDLQSAMSDWFMGNELVVDFIRYWLGYSLTTSTSRQEFMVVWGESAGNGKSTLFGDIVPTIMRKDEGNTRDSFEHTLNIKDLLVQNSANSDSTYNLAGKRYARMSEPKIDNRQKLDNEMVKRLTGDSTYSVSAKYKNEITFRPIAKIVALCNSMMKVDCDDAGILRRLVVVEMNTKFVNQDDWERLTDAEKATGRFKRGDPKAVSRIKANTEGTLRYFLEGATAFVHDPERPVPEAMRNSKGKAQDNLDDILQWIRGGLVPCDAAEKSHVKMSALKTYWRQENIQFTTKRFNEKGFNELFYKKCEAAGLTVKYDPKRPDMGRVENVRLYADEPTDAEE